MKIAIIGTGNLGSAIAKGILHRNVATHLYLTKRNPELLEQWTRYGNVTVSPDNREAVAHSDILILAVQPQQLPDVLTEISGLLGEKHILISTVTGFLIPRIESLTGQHIPVIRSMPNTAISVGKSMTCLCANTAGEKRIDIARAIFNTMGHSLVIPEAQMQAATVICASGIAFWMRLIRATSQGAIQLGFDAELAQELAMHTCEGAAHLLIQTGNHPESEIDRVTTPMGCTIEGLNEMEQGGLSGALIKGLLKSYAKITQIRNT